MIRDVELAEEALPKKAGGPQGSRRCLCLSLFSFLLVAGATTLFCLLHLGVIGPQREEVSALPASAPHTTKREVGGERGAVGREHWRKMGRQKEGWRDQEEKGGERTCHPEGVTKHVLSE